MYMMYIKDHSTINVTRTAYLNCNNILVVVVLGFYVSPKAKVIRRRDLGLKSHPKDWRSPVSNSRPLASGLTTTQQRLLQYTSNLSYDPQSNNVQRTYIKHICRIIRSDFPWYDRSPTSWNPGSVSILV